MPGTTEKSTHRARTGAPRRTSAARAPCRRSGALSRWTWPAAPAGDHGPKYESHRLGKGGRTQSLIARPTRNGSAPILSGVVENQKVSDPVIRQALTEDWPLSRLDSTLRGHPARAGVYELMKRKDVPASGHSFGNMSTSAKAFLRGTRAQAGECRARPCVPADQGEGRSGGSSR